MNKILFLDLDGTVRRTKSGATFINDPYDQELIPGAQEAIARHEDWTIIGITDQGGVLAGFKSFDTCVNEQKYTLELLPAISHILFCPDAGNQCWFVKTSVVNITVEELKGTYRKPNSGMINHSLGDWSGSAKDYYFTNDFDKTKDCVFVGDRPEDQQVAINANIPFVWAHEWRRDDALN
jgi:D-glycero-D-manno-heptose 1,7-bisphosphate phosphatase